MSDFQERFNQLITENNLSVRKCADVVGIPWQTVHSYMRGKVDARAYNVIMIAEAFDVTTDWLLGVSNVRERFYDGRMV